MKTWAIIMIISLTLLKLIINNKLLVFTSYRFFKYTDIIFLKPKHFDEKNPNFVFVLNNVNSTISKLFKYSFLKIDNGNEISKRFSSTYKTRPLFLNFF